MINNIEAVILKNSNKAPKLELFGDKLIKSANNYEKIDKNERKRRLGKNQNQDC